MGRKVGGPPMIVGFAYILHPPDRGICSYRKLLIQLDFNPKLASAFLGSSILSTFCLVDIRLLTTSIAIWAFVAADSYLSSWLFWGLSITDIDSVSVVSSVGLDSLKSSLNIRVGCSGRWW